MNWASGMRRATTTRSIAGDVLNEPDLEHDLSPEVYSKLYDAVVTAVHQGVAADEVRQHLEFLRRRASRHDRLLPRPQASPAGNFSRLHFLSFLRSAGVPKKRFQFIPTRCFDQADRFLEVVGYVETIRKRLSPKTGTMVDEIGTMLPTDWDQGKPGYVFKPIAPAYWNLSAAVYAYVFAGLARQGIDVATESLIPGYPGQFPSIAILDWNTGAPNARYRVCS